MDHLARLQLAGRVTYYIGWIAALCGAVAHFSLATRMFISINLTQRNLFEASVLFFLICTASELRALVLFRSQEVPMGLKTQAAQAA
jgi:hypothetical protein